MYLKNRLKVQARSQSGSKAGDSESEWKFSICVLLVVVEAAAQISPGESTNISVLLAVEASHLPQSACAKEDAL